ncbi:glycoside hydrolase family 6 protein [Pendulispora rubella]|uniref:glycoside hydrolase family 6 protein n=1 Tax=Pendulispora rubella TaxID=2741070 RepID=UPI00374E057E
MKSRRMAAASIFLSTVGCGGSGAENAEPKNAEEANLLHPNAVEAPAAPSGFYVDPNSNPAIWVDAHGSDSRAASIRANISTKPMARWFGNWSGDIGAAVSSYVGAAASHNQWPILVAYDIPGRDCGGHSSGGAGSVGAYRTWIATFAAGVGDRPAMVVLEPDALAQLDCLPNDTERTIRTDLLRYATEMFRDKAPSARVYLDAGHAAWIAAPTMATRLHAAGIGNIRGFAINVSNYQTTSQSNAYGGSVNGSLSSQYGYTKSFVVDTSRNGNGSNGEWCNPPGRKLGAVSQFGGGADALLWLKVPGNSDGECGIAPSTPAGIFNPTLADRLIQGT